MATPDHYPLTPNTLVAACNQSSNRNPVVSYERPTVVEAGGRLKAIGLARVVHSPSNRAEKYRHVVDEALGLEPGAIAVLCELLVRGPQTPGELRARTRALAARDIAVDDTLDTLAAHADGPLARTSRSPARPSASTAGATSWARTYSDSDQLGGQGVGPVTLTAPSSDAASDTASEDLAERVARAQGTPGPARVRAGLR